MPPLIESEIEPPFHVPLDCVRLFAVMVADEALKTALLARLSDPTASAEPPALNMPLARERLELTVTA